MNRPCVIDGGFYGPDMQTDQGAGGDEKEEPRAEVESKAHGALYHIVFER